MPESSPISIYNASAGSGKTYNLVKEYIKILLLSSIQNKHRHLLAITFTNKAVAEMKERVLGTLRDFAAHQDQNENPSTMLLDVAEETGMSHKEIALRAFRIITIILHNYAAFDIVTIDTLTHRILRTFSKDLGLAGNFEVSLEIKSLLSRAVDRVIAKTGRDKQVTNILVNYALQKADEDKDWNISRDLNNIAALLNQENDAAAMATMKEKSLAEFDTLSKLLASNRKNVINKIKKQALGLLEVFTEMGVKDSHFSRKTFYNHVSRLAGDPLSIKFDSKSKWQNDIEGYSFYNKSTEESAKNSIDSLRDTLIAFFKETKNYYYEALKLREFERKLVPLSTLQLISNELEIIKQEQNILLISDFNTIIHKSLKDQPAAFIYERLGERYSNYFIDEFQDTSILQWNNLIPLVDNALVSESNDVVSNSLLIVGDPKQAIYRWRGGKAEQFIDLGKNMTPFHSQKASIIQLDTNYRSHKEVIAFNNAFFSHIAQVFDEPVYKRIYEQDNNQAFNERDGGFVSIEFIDASNNKEADEIYPQRVLETINSASLDGFEKSAICILVRNNKQGAHIAQFLAEKNIQVVSSDSLLLKNSDTVLFIHDILLLQTQPKNSALATRVLLFLASKNKVEDVHSFLDKWLKSDSANLSSYLETINIHFSAATFASLPLYEAAEYVIRCFHLIDMADSYVMGYLDALFNFTTSKNEGLIGFLNYWEEKKSTLSIDAPLQKDAVQVMTIHKSKGLEFPIVIFPYADADLYTTNNEHHWYDVAPEHNEGFSKLMINHSAALKNYGQQGASLYAERHNEQQFDNINVLYVALTRAVQRLYVLSRFRESVLPKNYSHLFTDYLRTSGKLQEGQLRYTFGQERTTQDSKSNFKETISIPFVSSSKEDHNIRVVTRNGAIPSQERTDAISYGNLMHDILAQIKTPDDINNVLADFVLDGQLLEAETGEIKKILLRITHHPKIKKYFDQEAIIYNEKAILSKDGAIFIPDRIVVLPNDQAAVIDYKTGLPKEEHGYQLDNYAALLAEMDIEVSNKILIYINEEINVLTV